MLLLLFLYVHKLITLLKHDENRDKPERAIVTPISENSHSSTLYVCALYYVR